jgi:hypothetical protein
MESSIASGTLSGVDLSGDVPEAELPADETPVPVVGQEPEPEPKSAPTPEPAKADKDGAPARHYVVLKQEEFDDGSSYYVEVHRVEARNAQNAMRKAFKDLNGEDAGEATLCVVPQTMWKPKKVRIAKTERTTVSFED